MLEPELLEDFNKSLPPRTTIREQAIQVIVILILLASAGALFAALAR